MYIDKYNSFELDLKIESNNAYTFFSKFETLLINNAASDYVPKVKNKDFSFIVNKLNIDNILYIGIRDINKYEKMGYYLKI